MHQFHFLFVLFLLHLNHAIANTHVVYSAPASLSVLERGLRLPKTATIRMNIALRTPKINLNTATEALQEISDPQSPDFGKHWTGEQVAKFFAPSRDAIEEVVTWLNASGIDNSTLSISADRGHIYFNTTVHQAEQLVQAKYFAFEIGNQVQIASDVYYLPVSVSQHVDFVLPGLQPSPPTAHQDSIPLNSKLNLRETMASTTLQVDCFKFMSPQCLSLLYSISKGVNNSAHPRNTFGIYEPAWISWLPEDLDKFFSNFQPDLIGHRPTILPVDGGYLQTDVKNTLFNIEADLDFQYAMSLAYPQTVTNIQVGDKFLLGNLNNMLSAFDKSYCGAFNPDVDPAYPDITNVGGYNSSDCGTQDPPLVLSVSYVENEAWFPREYTERQCQEFLKLGLQGVSVIVASGDRGPADQLGSCVDPISGSPNVTQGIFSSNFPASCPWVTTVGATQLSTTNQTWVDDSTPFPRETTYNQFLNNNSTHASSGGGFSRLFSAPFYQAEATHTYLNQRENKAHLLNLSSSGYFNHQGRGYPDVSIIAANYLAVVDGAFHLVFGTSGSTPVFSSMIAKINDARLHAGKRPVGFLNPVLYAYGEEIMRDITTGTNSGCGVEKAFPAGRGWDAATGLGTPDYAKLAKLYLRLP